jgi:endogenous inhibitor of DNA gyrase (YacG/DUF329 family)
MSEQRGTNVICPTCKNKGDWFAGKYGPFCSQRCKMIDLGKWFGGEHTISEPLKAEHFNELEDEENGQS